MRRVKDQDDPRRCRATAADGGQCWNESVEDNKFCLAHGGREHPLEEMKDYLTEQFERRVRLNSDTDEIKVLKENLMRINAMLAYHSNKVKDEASLLANSASILDYTEKAAKITVLLNRLEISSNSLLAIAALKTWGQRIVLAVDKMVRDKYEGWEDDLMNFADIVAEIIDTTHNVKEEK